MNKPDLNSTFTISEQRKLRPAVLAGLCIGNDPRFERSMRELAACAEAVSCEVRAVFTQNLPKEHAGLYFGAGKVAEIRAYLDEINKAADPIDLVIIDASLSPKQLKNLGDMLGADLLLIIADLTDPEYRNSVSVTIRTLEEIGAGDIPRIFVFNKADAAETASPVISHREIRPEDGRITISAKDPADLERLTDLIYDRLREGNISCDLLIPYSEGAALHDLMDRGDAKIISYTDTGTLVHCSIKRGLYGRYAGYRAADGETLIQGGRK